MQKTADQLAKARRIAENAGEDVQKKREKLEWMYGQKENDEEDYLMGKALKDGDELDFCRQEEKRVEDSFGSIYSKRDTGSKLQVDMAAKLREDPMAYIKKSDDDAWRLIYENPVKMALLRTLLRPMMEKRKKKMKRAKQKAEGKKKKEKPDSSSSSSDDSSDSEGEEKDSRHGNPKPRRSSDVSPPNKHRRQSGDSSPTKHGRGYGLEVKDGGVKNSQDSDSDKNDGRTYKFIERRKLEQEKRKQLEQKSRDNIKKKKAVMTEEEMEAKRREMMSNAEERNKERKANVKKYREEERREVKEEKDEKEKASHFSDTTQPDFVRPLVNQAYTSAEDRIKRNIYSVQRSKADQDKNFTKR